MGLASLSVSPLAELDHQVAEVVDHQPVARKHDGGHAGTQLGIATPAWELKNFYGNP
jgi:hypothetical protein